MLIDQAGDPLVEFEATIKVHLCHQPSSSATPAGVCPDEEMKSYEKERALIHSQDASAKRTREPLLSEVKNRPSHVMMVDYSVKSTNHNNNDSQHESQGSQTRRNKIG